MLWLYLRPDGALLPDATALVSRQSPGFGKAVVELRALLLAAVAEGLVTVGPVHAGRDCSVDEFDVLSSDLDVWLPRCERRSVHHDLAAGLSFPGGERLAEATWDRDGEDLLVGAVESLAAVERPERSAELLARVRAACVLVNVVDLRRLALASQLCDEAPCTDARFLRATLTGAVAEGELVAYDWRASASGDRLDPADGVAALDELLGRGSLLLDNNVVLALD